MLVDVEITRVYKSSKVYICASNDISSTSYILHTDHVAFKSEEFRLTVDTVNLSEPDL